MPYIYNDEDNAPMFDYPWDSDHNPTVYLDRAQMKAEEALPFTDPLEEPPEFCGNCVHFDGDCYCTKWWNNMEKPAHADDFDKVNLTDWCEDWEREEDGNGDT